MWLLDRRTEQPVGMGIAELDETIGEGSLEWIQVLPELRGSGLGSALVAALLHRLARLADFTTVAGRLDNVTPSIRLYRRCGFVGNDVWSVLRRPV